MKRFLLILVIIAVAFTVFVDVFIPAEIYLSQKIKVETTERGITKFVLHTENWKAWWPVKTHQTYTYKNYSFIPINITVGGADITIQKQGNAVASKLLYAITGEKEAELTWLASVKTSYNPVIRISNFLKMRTINMRMHGLLFALKTFLNDDRKVYGLDFTVEKIRHPLVLTTHQNTRQYPQTNELYDLINILRKKASQNELVIIDSPMLNVTKLGADYRATAGITINKEIPKSGAVYISRLVPGGNVLTTTVKGGNNTAKAALATMEDFMNDHQLVSPAMPFQQLIVNRQLNPDTTKWITKLCYPIF